MHATKQTAPLRPPRIPPAYPKTVRHGPLSAYGGFSFRPMWHAALAEFEGWPLVHPRYWSIRYKRSPSCRVSSSPNCNEYLDYTSVSKLLFESQNGLGTRRYALHRGHVERGRSSLAEASCQTPAELVLRVLETCLHPHRGIIRVPCSYGRLPSGFEAFQQPCRH